MRDLIVDAIDDFNKFLQTLKDGGKSEIGKSFKARCREIPSLIEDVGLLSALSFCYAKATEDIYKKDLEVLKKVYEIGASQEKNKIEEVNAVKQGYGVYLYLILRKLNDIGLIKADTSQPLSALRQLKMKERIAIRLIRPYLIQLKRLSEAIFRG